MTPDKRRKIKTLLNNPASTENEKAICRKLLKDNPATESKGTPVSGYDLRDRMSGIRTPRSQESQDFWNRQKETPWVRLPNGFFDELYGGVAGLGQQYAAQREKDVSNKTAWEKFREKIYSTKEERDRVITLQREAIRNKAQQRLVDLLKKRK